MTSDQEALREALHLIAPGTALREGLERIQLSHTGALIVLGYSPEVAAICSGGFRVDTEFSASRLRELCKMDGAVVVDTEEWIIRLANVQLLPDPSIPTNESGMRHRTAQRTARQTGLPVLSLSASMRIISVYLGDLHYTVDEPETLLARANQAVDTLDRYTQRLEEVVTTLGILEMRDEVAIRDVATVIQRMEMIRRITAELNGYIDELGADGRLLALQVDDLLRGAASERALVLRDYIRSPELLGQAEQQLSALSGESLVDLTQIANILGLGAYEPSDLDRNVVARGVRVLAMVPRLPWTTVQIISEKWPTLTALRNVTTEDLQTIEGIGPYRAQMIVEHLQEREQLASELAARW
ncbi:DNA integrity scanning protein DisA [Actinomycetaceae bacterium WB03_NA08]|uniref:DNA integrity scanning protein DisA n=1 Tax=Scrofimicrobium canadense TaxID=2652290 RepID=A0A6N7VQY3_9ACTO|nr:DNA integrity scanning diadenylate cyclase DisA [Scrofimicrobium canadense]MSS84159.1 DNA integrity scanning protein DisA [Scrofimicrobium canadense]